MIKLPEAKETKFVYHGGNGAFDCGYESGWNAAIAEVQRLNATAQPVSDGCKVPEGWKLVPIDPTEEMLIDGFESEPDEGFSEEAEWERYQAMSGCEQAKHRARLCWNAMLAAAPGGQGS